MSEQTEHTVNSPTESSQRPAPPEILGQAGRRGPFPRRNPADPLTDHFRERSRAKVQLASAVLRQLEFARNLEDKEDIARGIRQTVKTFQFLLFEQNRPAI